MSLSSIRVFAAGMFLAAAFRLPASDFVVTSLADSGPGSLRAALLQANAMYPYGGHISFSVSGVIKLESPLTVGTRRDDRWRRADHPSADNPKRRFWWRVITPCMSGSRTLL